MIVLANDGLAQEGIKIFKDRGIDVATEKRDLKRLIEEIPGIDALLVRSATKVTREIIEAGARGNIKIIGRAGVGYDNVDVEAASEHGIVVKYAPYGNTNSTAELALGLMIAVSRNIPQAHSVLKNGVWSKRKYEGVELSGKTLGIIGCGRIGQRLSQLAIGFDMDVIGYDKMVEDVRARFPDSRIKYHPEDYVLKKADYVSIHASGKDVIIGEKELRMMKSTAYLVNTSRGGCVDETALYGALNIEGYIAGAGLDVFVDEPKKEGQTFENRFRNLDNVIMTSHLGASTKEAQIKTSIEIATVVAGYLIGEEKLIWANAVNAGEEISTETKPVYTLFVYHQDVPGMFAKIDDALGRYGVNIREISARRLNDNSQAVYLLTTKPNENAIREIGKIEGVKRVTL